MSAMKRTARLLLVALAAVAVLAPLAGADQHVVFTGSSDHLTVITANCPGFATLQPSTPPSQAFLVPVYIDASWQGTWILPSASGFPLISDIRGRMKGDGIDVNTGLTYSLMGDFSEDVLPEPDILGDGHFTVKRSDGARMAFDAAFQVAGDLSPILLTDTPTVVCTPPTHE
jgi:hypothetical protein